MTKILVALSSDGIFSIRFDPENDPNIPKILSLLRQDPLFTSFLGSIANKDTLCAIVSFLKQRMEQWIREAKIDPVQVLIDT